VDISENYEISQIICIQPSGDPPREEPAGVILDTVGPGGQVGGGQSVRDGVERGEAHHTFGSQR
jgi:hypothetical protein